MTKTEVMRDFIRKTVLPVVVALLLFSMLFELYAHIISTVYGLDDRFVDFLYHLESKIVRFLTVCGRIEFFLKPGAKLLRNDIVISHCQLNISPR